MLEHTLEDTIIIQTSMVVCNIICGPYHNTVWAELGMFSPSYDLRKQEMERSNGIQINRDNGGGTLIRM